MFPFGNASPGACYGSGERLRALSIRLRGSFPTVRSRSSTAPGAARKPSGEGAMIDFRRMALDLAALGLFAFLAFAGLSLASYDPADPPGDSVFPPSDVVVNLCGPAGAVVAHEALSAVGFGAYYLIYSLVLVDVRLLARSGSSDNICKPAGWAITLIAACAGLSLLLPALPGTAASGSGGRLGTAAAALLTEQFSAFGGLIFITAALAAGMILTGDLDVVGSALKIVLWPFRVLWQVVRMAVWIALLPLRLVLWPFRRRTVVVPDEQSAASDEAADDDAPAVLKLIPGGEKEEQEEEEVAFQPALKIAAADDADEDDAPAALPMRPIKVNPPVAAIRAPHIAAAPAHSNDAADPHELPELDLLDEAEEFPYELLAEKARAAAQTLEQTFQEFGLNVTVSEVDTGPVVTQFELNLEKGLRVSKVTALADDLAIALRVPAVRVVSPIPGKNTVGVEVPNEKQVMVRLRELIEAAPGDKHRIPLFLGKDVSGRPLVVDLTKMPHLLIAGRTGTGKSVCLNTLIIERKRVV
jgi:S-DNA-T family DNA segregation ATPase FtsK/SpoIIIE